MRGWRVATLLAAVAAVAAVAVAACGETIAFEGAPTPPQVEAGPPAPRTDAGTLTPSRRCTSDPFGTPVKLGPEINRPGHIQQAGRLSPDRLRIWFGRAPLVDGSRGDFDLYTARRASADTPFEEAEPLAALSSPSDDHYPSFGDGLIVFSSNRDGGTGGLDLWGARGDGVAFAAPSPVVSLNDGGTDTPYLTTDGRALYFKRGSEIMVSRRPAGTDDFEAPVSIPEVDTADPEQDPVVTSDQRVMYLRQGGSAGSIVRAERSDPSAPFSPPALVPTLLVGTSQAPTWVSDDDCTIVIVVRFGPVGGELYIAERPPAGEN